ncbi:MAG: hypothetical protein HQ541_01865 [Mariniphaga sp.]|nr:hypothetical protein [Mariniphaga sp.]
MKHPTIHKLFDTLDKWRTFPAYQLERRADIFFAIYLKKIIYHKFGVEVDHILPEFSVRLGTIYGNNDNQSYKIDYVAVSQQKNKIYFVELKTDMSSRRENQDDYLKLAKKANIPKLMDGILKIYEATSAKIKYENYLNELVDVGWLSNESYENISNNYDISIVYLQPTVEDEDPKQIISFDEVIKALMSETDPITRRFVESLKKWKTKPSHTKERIRSI